MFPYWADVVKDVGDSGEAGPTEKVVVSRSLETASRNTTIISSDSVAELWSLKHQSGKTISVDTLSMLPELIGEGLIDEFHLVVRPVMAGIGRHLLDAGGFREIFKPG